MKSSKLIALVSVTSLAAMAFILLSTFRLPSASALSGSNFKAGRIMDDSVFFNPGTMSATDIQNFLNSKVPHCDTNGTQTSEFGGGTRAQFGTSKGYTPPYTCLKDYSQNFSSMAADSYCSAVSGGTKSAAQIIKDVAAACSINPEVILVLLQKEQGLVTDEWPWSVQYQSATGYACPDTASCDPAYAGFFKQVYYGARQYQKYAKQASQFNYQAYQTESILYNPNAACGSSQVYIQNQATAGLYNYTPYQPNNAALANLYGTGDGCSAYGNRNFWRQFIDWFGPTTSDSSIWGVIFNAGKKYLVIGREYYYIPNPSIDAAWGLDDESPMNNDPNLDPASFLSSLTKGPNIGYVALDAAGTRYMMDNGKKYRLKDDAHVLAWGMAGDAAQGIYAVGLLGLTPSGGNVGRFGVSSTSGVAYLMDGTHKYSGQTAQSLSYWGYSSEQATTVTDDILSRLGSGTIDRYVDADGVKGIIDNSTFYKFKVTGFQQAWGSPAYAQMRSFATNMLSSQLMGNFVRADGQSAWYYLENGIKHYASSAELAGLWGYGDNDPLTVISPDLLSTLTNGGSLSYIAANSSGKQYILDGSKHWIPSLVISKLWADGLSIPTYSDAAFGLLPTGSDASSALVGFKGMSAIFVLDSRMLHSTGDVNTLDAFGANRNNPIQTYSKNLYPMLERSQSASFVVKDDHGNPFYLENGYISAINPAFIGTWRAADAPVFDSNSLMMFTDSGHTLSQAVSNGGRKYVVNGNSYIDVSNDYANYGLSASDFVPITRRYLPPTASSYLVGAVNSNKIWALSMGARYYIPSSSLLDDLGYARVAGLIILRSDVAAALPVATSDANRLIASPDSGVVIAIQGSGYGFRDLATLKSFAGNSDIMILPDRYFQLFGLNGWASRLVYGTDGKIYYMDSGQKDWVSNPQLLNTSYSGISWWRLPQPTLNDFPDGPKLR